MGVRQLRNPQVRGSIPLRAAFISKLAHEVPNIADMKDTSGDMTLTEECVRLNRDIDFKVFGGRGARNDAVGMQYLMLSLGERLLLTHNSN